MTNLSMVLPALMSSLLTYMRTELSNATKDKGNAGSHASKKPKLSSSARIVPCTQCFTKGWECDNDDPVSGCKNCQLRGKASKCKRVMCRNYNGDTCMYSAFAVDS